MTKTYSYDNDGLYYAGYMKITAPEVSEWSCHLFGVRGDINFVPLKGHEPNWFWRTMQYLLLGNKWVKNG